MIGQGGVNLRKYQPTVTMPTRRPPGARNKKNRTRVEAYDESTQCKTSGLERVWEQQQ